AALNATLGAWSDSERYSKTVALSRSGLSSLTSYIDYAVKPQLAQELGQVPDDLTFVFGHTHKPFVEEIVPSQGNTVPVCNTGGWYLDNIRLDSADGAAMVLIDEHLNAVWVRYFAVPINRTVPETLVTLVSKPSDSAKAFLDQIRAWVEADSLLWRGLSKTASKDYRLRQTAELPA
ncbi:MAG: hypothetical protein AAFY03_08675, partial [Pseudomonadota bacterium]